MTTGSSRAPHTTDRWPHFLKYPYTRLKEAGCHASVCRLTEEEARELLANVQLGVVAYNDANPPAGPDREPSTLLQLPKKRRKTPVES